MQVPTFIVIGGMKCGTTSLYHYLSQHPEVGVSRTKEVGYFFGQKYRKKSMSWYERQFPVGRKAIGDVSPVYSKSHLDPGVARRIYNNVPDVKLIYLVRDPVDRFISHYKHTLAKTRTTLDVNSFVDLELAREGNIFLTGCYFKHIEAYLEYFSKDQLLVVESESLQLQTFQQLSEIFNFVGVGCEFADGEFYRKYHQSSDKRNLNGFGRVLRRFMTEKQTLKICRTMLGRRLLSSPIGSISLSGDSKDALATAYAPWNKKLREFTGMAFTHWSDFGKRKEIKSAVEEGSQN